MSEDCCSFLKYRQELSEVRRGGLRESRSRGIARRLLELSGIQAGIVEVRSGGLRERRNGDL